MTDGAVMTRGKLEVHEHCYIRGPLARRSPEYKFSHSHAGGDVAHEHPDTGPASYTIDRDAWRAATGLRGGGRKKYTAKPTGPQLAVIAMPAERLTYDVIIVPNMLAATVARGDGAVEIRLARAHQMTPRRRRPR